MLKKEAGISLRNRGQLTIFIIAGILIVSAVVLFFLFRTGIIPEIGGGTKGKSVNAFLSSCLEDKVREAAREISLRGGEMQSQLSLPFTFTEENIQRNISYLCYTQNNFRPCVVQKPALILNVQNEIKNYISSEVQGCFNEMESNFESQGFSVSRGGLNDFDVKLMPRKIAIQTSSEITLTKNEETTTEKDFEIVVLSRTYELLGLASEIINSETQFCYFEDTGFEITYPEYSIDRFIVESGVRIYTLENKETTEKFRFVVRSCAIPPGF